MKLILFYPLGGIEVKYNHELGKDISLADLQANYDAVYLGFGVGIARQLDIEGEHWKV
jgi:dihydropyrimidine dehydrogenase (NAD+) subunit PreT